MERTRAPCGRYSTFCRNSDPGVSCCRLHRRCRVASPAIGCSHERLSRIPIPVVVLPVQFFSMYACYLPDIGCQFPAADRQPTHPEARVVHCPWRHNEFLGTRGEDGLTLGMEDGPARARPGSRRPRCVIGSVKCCPINLTGWTDLIKTLKIQSQLLNSLTVVVGGLASIRIFSWSG
jgi:hypothetical protein